MTRPILFRVIAVLFGVALSLVVFEGALRLNRVLRPETAAAPAAVAREPERRGAVGWDVEPTPWFNKYDGRAVSQRSQGVPFGELACDNQSGPESKPDCEKARHNSSGFRMPEFTIAHPPNTFRIVIVGDSFTWGDGTELADTFHQQLQRRFDAAKTDSAPKVEVIGLGVNGASFTDNVTRLLTYGQRLQPDLVILQFFNNDLQQRTILDLLDADADENYAAFLFETTAAGRFVRERVGRLRREDLWNAEMERMYDSGSQEWRMFTSGLATLDRWRSLGVPVAVASFSEVDNSPETKNYQHFQHPPGTFKLRERAEAEIERHGFPLLRIAEIFKARAGETFLAASPTNAHYSKAANTLVADAMFEFVRDASWVNLAKPRARGDDKRWAAEREIRDRAATQWRDYRYAADLQITMFGRLLELYPEDPFLTQDLGRVHLAVGKFDLCRASFLRMAELAPEFSTPGYYLSQCTGDVAERATFLAQTLEVIPDHAGAAMRLAELDAKAGRMQRACGCYSRLSQVATYTNQAKDAIDSARRFKCPRVAEQPCPGQDPFESGER